LVYTCLQLLSPLDTCSVYPYEVTFLLSLQNNFCLKSILSDMSVATPLDPIVCKIFFHLFPLSLGLCQWGAFLVEKNGPVLFCNTTHQSISFNWRTESINIQHYYFLFRFVFYIFFFQFLFYSYVHTMLGSFLPPSPPPPLPSQHPAPSSPPLLPCYSAETILPLSLILLKTEYKQ
jgi:hypothetical protein